MKAVETAPHEYMANYVYDDGLGPWFGAARLCDATGSRRGTFRLNGEEWRVTLSYQESGLVPPDGGETPDGTRGGLLNTGACRGYGRRRTVSAWNGVYHPTTSPL